jgi:hypothetical protein
MQSSLFSWIRSHGGYINPKLELSMGPNYQQRGLYAAENIEPEELLVELPREIQFCAPDLCSLIEKIHHEFEKGNQSFWWPYLSIIVDDDIDIPAIWNAEEIGFLNGLQPGNWRDHLTWFRETCHGDLANPVQLKAMLFGITRGRGDEDHMCMNPLFDMIAHNYIADINTHFHLTSSSSSSPSPTSWTQISSTFISQGKILTNSYGSEDSGRLFRDYGLVIPFNEPCEWYFTDSHGNVLHYGLYPTDGDGDGENFQLLIPENTDLESFYEQLHSLLHYVLTTSPARMTPNKDDESRTLPFPPPSSSSSASSTTSSSHLYPDQMMISKHSKVTSKRYLLASRYRYHYLKSLRIASNLVEIILEEREQKNEMEEGNGMESETIMMTIENEEL